MDLISRRAAIDALAKFVPYAICDESTESYTNGLTDAYNLICQLPSVQTEKTQLSEEDATKSATFDCISRQAAIDALNKMKIYRPLDSDRYVISDCLNKIVNLPSAQPEHTGTHSCDYQRTVTHDWIPVTERLPKEEDCPMDCLVTRKSKFIGNYTDMAVCEKNGTWTHEDWDAIVLGDVKDGKSTGLISTRDDNIIAWMPLPEPYKEGQND